MVMSSHKLSLEHLLWSQCLIDFLASTPYDQVRTLGATNLDIDYKRGACDLCVQVYDASSAELWIGLPTDNVRPVRLPRGTPLCTNIHTISYMRIPCGRKCNGLKGTHEPTCGRCRLLVYDRLNARDRDHLLSCTLSDLPVSQSR